MLQLSAAPVGARDDGNAARSIDGADPAPPPPKRPVPNYDGREPEPVTAAEKAMWIPRGALYPAHVALRLTLEKPIVAALELIERYHVNDWLEWLFFWKDGKIGFFPTVYYEFDLNVSFGFFFFIKDILTPGHALILEANFWFGNWRDIRFDNRLKIGPNGSLLALRLRHLDRPDQLYHGVGPATFDADRSYYRLGLVDVSAGLRALLPDLHRLRLDLAWRRCEFERGQTPSVETKHPLEENPELIGLGGYQLIEGRAHLDIDSRKKSRFRSSGSGVRVEVFGSYGINPGDADLQVFTWGTETSGFVDVTGRNHVLAVRGYVEFAEQVGSRPIPVTELITLGGLERMRGFLPGRFHGRSALVATLQYRYPIWTYLDADLFMSFGNAFDERLEGFELRQLHMTSGFAVRTNGSRQVSFDLLVGLGTNRLDSQDVRIESVHLAVGINHGF